MRSRRWIYFVGGALVLLLAAGLAWWRLQDVDRLRIAAGTHGSVVHELGVALADTLNANVSNLRVSVVEGADTRDSLSTLLQGGSELAVAFSDSEGDGVVRTLVPLYELYLYMIVWEDAAISDVPALKGRKIGIGPKNSGTDGVARRLFEHYQLGNKDVTLVNASYRNITNAFTKRELDAVFILASIESPAVETMLRAPGAQLLSLDDPELSAPAMMGIRSKHPFVVSHVIPKHVFGGKPTKPTGVIGVNALLVARADLPDEIARDVTRAVFDHRLDLGQKVPRLRELDERFDQHQLRFPLHPGASQYYHRDEPPAIVTWAEPISLFITVALLGWSGLAAIAARRRATRKTLLDELYKDFFKVVQSYDDESETPPDQMTQEQLQAIREKLQGLRRRSFEALMSGRIEPNDAFVVFSDYLRYELTEIERIQRERRREHGPSSRASGRGAARLFDGTDGE